MLYWILRGIIKFIGEVLIALFGGMRVEGIENLPAQGPVIIAPNHLSFADPLLLGVSMPRGAYYMASDEVFRIPLLGALSRWLRGFPVRQDSPDRRALRFTQELMERGEAVVAFPEGHISHDGRLQPIQPGMVMGAMHSGAPVVPVALIGSNDFVPYRQWRPRRVGKPMIVRFGRPITADELSGGLKGRKGIDHGVTVLESRLRELLAQPADCCGKDSPCAIIKSREAA